MPRNNPVWSFFTSVKLAIALLTLISIASILGTLIPQQQAAGPFVADLSPGVARFLDSLQLFNIFHSGWFMALLTLLAINLIVCSLNRFPQTWRRFRGKGKPDRDDVFEHIPAAQIIVRQTALPLEADRIKELIGKKVNAAGNAQEGPYYLFTEKGALSCFGVYIVHASILVLMMGAMAGLLLGFKGYMQIPEGESSSVVTLTGGQGKKTLDFAVRCDRFLLDFYETGAPKTYRSDLTFLRNGQASRSSSVLVNHPVSFAGIRFYQSSYGALRADHPVITVILDDKEIMEVKTAPGMEFGLPTKKATVRVLRLEDNLMGMGPAVKLNVKSPDGSIEFWVFEAIEQIVQANPGIIEQVPLFNPGAFTPYVFSLTSADIRYYTGLQVARDPGGPLVAAGAALMIIGLLMVFFWSHRQIWIRIETGGDRTQISIAGRSSRDAVGLNREIRKWAALIKKGKETSS